MTQGFQWQRAGLDLSVAVNLSPQLLNDLSFPDHVEQVAAIGLERRRVVFEVTESAAMADPAATMEVLTRLRVKNFGLSIDDFGTGYSSLKTAVPHAVQRIKNRYSFVRDVSDHDEARTMVETMVLLAHKLQLTACAKA